MHRAVEIFLGLMIGFALLAAGLAQAAGVKANRDHPLSIQHWVQVHGEAGEDPRLADLLQQAGADEPDVNAGGDDNLFIMYTSGTTGLPKGVVHTHETISWAAMSWATTMDIRYRDRTLLPLPMFHVAALTSVITGSIVGGTIVSMPNFDPMSVWSLIREERVTTGGSVPAILNFMRQVPDFATFESEHFRCFITGAAPMPKSLIEIYNEKNMQVVQGYALTETGGGGTFLLNEYALGKIGSAALPWLVAEQDEVDTSVAERERERQHREYNRRHERGGARLHQLPRPGQGLHLGRSRRRWGWRQEHASHRGAVGFRLQGRIIRQVFLDQGAGIGTGVPGQVESQQVSNDIAGDVHLASPIGVPGAEAAPAVRVSLVRARCTLTRAAMVVSPSSAPISS